MCLPICYHRYAFLNETARYSYDATDDLKKLVQQVSRQTNLEAAVTLVRAAAVAKSINDLSTEMRCHMELVEELSAAGTSFGLAATITGAMIHASKAIALAHRVTADQEQVVVKKALLRTLEGFKIGPSLKSLSKFRRGKSSTRRIKHVDISTSAGTPATRWPSPADKKQAEEAPKGKISTSPTEQLREAFLESMEVQGRCLMHFSDRQWLRKDYAGAASTLAQSADMLGKAQQLKGLQGRALRKLAKVYSEQAKPMKAYDALSAARKAEHIYNRSVVLLPGMS